MSSHEMQLSVSSPLTAAMGEGLAFLDNLQFQRGKNLYGDFSNFFAQTKAAQTLTESGGQLAQEWIRSKTYEKQVDSMSVWEKHIHLSAEKARSLQDKRETYTVLAGVCTQILLRAGFSAIGSWAKNKEKAKVAEGLFDLLSFAGSSNNEIPLYNQAVISRVLSQFRLSTEDHRKIVSRPIPESLISIPAMSGKLDRKEQELLGQFVYVMRSNLGVKSFESDSQMIALYENLGLPGYEVPEFIRNCADTYEPQKSDLSQHYEAIRQIVADVSIDISIDINTIKRNALILASFDPQEEKRRRNRDLIKKGTLIGLPMVAMAYVGPLADAAIFGAYAATQSLIAGSDSSKQDVVHDAFSRITKKHGVDDTKLDSISEEAKKLARAL